MKYRIKKLLKKGRFKMKKWILMSLMSIFSFGGLISEEALEEQDIKLSFNFENKTKKLKKIKTKVKEIAHKFKKNSYVVTTSLLLSSAGGDYLKKQVVENEDQLEMRDILEKSLNLPCFIASLLFLGGLLESSRQGIFSYYEISRDWGQIGEFLKSLESQVENQNTAFHIRKSLSLLKQTQGFYKMGKIGVIGVWGISFLLGGRYDFKFSNVLAAFLNRALVYYCYTRPVLNKMTEIRKSLKQALKASSLA
jgi:hypothetical protein